MSHTNRIWAMLNAVIFIALLAVACGGIQGTGNVYTPPPPNPPTPMNAPFVSSAIPNNGSLHLAKPQSAASLWDRFSLVGTVHAQNPTPIVLSGNYSGYCPLVGFAATSPVGTILYGAGSMSTASCSNYYSGAGSDPGNSAALNATAGALVIGAGTLQGLVVADDKESVPVNSTSGKVEVWVLRSGEVLATPITATLGTGRIAEDSTDSFAVLDQDQIIVTITSNPNDSLSEVQWYLGKS
jgi:hypothetical protein